MKYSTLRVGFICRMNPVSILHMYDIILYNDLNTRTTVQTLLSRALSVFVSLRPTSLSNKKLSISDD